MALYCFLISIDELVITIEQMKDKREYFEERIVRQIGSVAGRKTVANIVDNLIEGVTLDLFEEDFKKGSGNELEAKFRAIYSSSALAANNFSIIKKKPFSFHFLNKSGFEFSSFERQFPTGLGGFPPNIDFVLENSKDIVAFESKYLEHLTKKPVSFALSYNKNRLPFLSEFWFKLIENYRGKILRLDVAQLIKHSIGLIRYNKSLKEKSKKITLVYIYWTPKNMESYDLFQSHSDELIEFENVMNEQNDINFIKMTYQEFWKMYENDKQLNEHYSKVKSRYDIVI